MSFSRKIQFPPQQPMDSADESQIRVSVLIFGLPGSGKGLLSARLAAEVPADVKCSMYVLLFFSPPIAFPCLTLLRRESAEQIVSHGRGMVEHDAFSLDTDPDRFSLPLPHQLLFLFLCLLQCGSNIAEPAEERRITAIFSGRCSCFPVRHDKCNRPVMAPIHAADVRQPAACEPSLLCWDAWYVFLLLLSFVLFLFCCVSC